MRSCRIDTCDLALCPQQDLQEVQPPLEVSRISMSMDVQEERVAPVEYDIDTRRNRTPVFNSFGFLSFGFLLV